jgi:hypothetical protein
MPRSKTQKRTLSGLQRENERLEKELEGEFISAFTSKRVDLEALHDRSHCLAIQKDSNACKA